MELSVITRSLKVGAIGLALLIPCSAQGQLVLGRLTDAATEDGIQDAEVILLDHDRSVVASGLSNTRGLFSIRLEEPAALLLTVSRLGYASGDTVSIIVPPDNSAHIDLELQPEGVELTGLVVTATRLSSTLARRQFYQRERRGFGSFLDAEYLQKQRGRRLLDLLRSVPGISVRDETPYITRAQRAHSNRCAPTLLLDGMTITGEQAFDRVPLEWIEGVEVYRSWAGMPAQWAHLGSCGLIVVWTY